MLLRRGLEETGDLWEPVRIAFAWVHGVAHILGNRDERDAAGVRRRLTGLVANISRHRAHAGKLQPAIKHFLKVTRSYWPGLFHCYDVPDLPRTNNDLEHCFGSHRYHERRATGRKRASGQLVLRGPVRLAASAATRVRRYTAEELAPSDVANWRTLRRQLDARCEARRQGLRFRRNPNDYLAMLECQLLKRTLPS